MPRTGYDLSGTADGSPAAEAASRAKNRRAVGSATPRPGTPANPAAGEEQKTPRAPRVDTGASTDFQPPMDPQVAWDSFFFQSQRAAGAGAEAGAEQMQNPLNLGAAQNSYSIAGVLAAPVASQGHGAAPTAPMSIFSTNAPLTHGKGAPVPSDEAAFAPNARFRRQGHDLRTWSDNMLRSRGMQPNAAADPVALSQFSYLNAITTSTAQASTSNSTNSVPAASGDAADDVEMTDSEVPPKHPNDRRKFLG